LLNSAVLLDEEAIPIIQMINATGIPIIVNIKKGNPIALLTPPEPSQDKNN